MTLDKEALQGLLDRVRAANGPDREIDWRIAEMLSIPEPWRGSTIWPPFMANSKFDKAIPAYTASLDVITALIERELPDWHIAMGTVGEQDMPWACLIEPEDPCRDFSASAPTITLALVEALLSAKLSQEVGK